MEGRARPWRRFRQSLMTTICVSSAFDAGYDSRSTILPAALARPAKAVIYQWESRKRTPSPVLWQQVLRLPLVRARTVEASAAIPKASREMESTLSEGAGGSHAGVYIGL